MSLEFITQLLQKESSLKDKSFLSVNSLMEQSTWNLDLIDNEYKTYLQEHLKIKDTTFLNFQINLLNNFKISKEIAPQKNIITNNDYIEFNKSFEINEFAYLDWLEKNNCKRGFSSISKPIFNETYNLAIIHFEQICGPLCGGGLIRLYELKNKKWVQKKVIDHWIQ